MKWIFSLSSTLEKNVSSSNKKLSINCRLFPTVKMMEHKNGLIAANRNPRMMTKKWIRPFRVCFSVEEPTVSIVYFSPVSANWFHTFQRLIMDPKVLLGT